MAMRVEQRGEEFVVVIPREAVEALHLTNGAEVELRPVDQPETKTRVEYASVEEALESFLRTEPLHRNTYTELAK
jgi:antitoxin component of MazEF toxin-antitoxin module